MKMEARHILANRKSVRSVVLLLFYLFTSLPLFAQEVTVQVTPVQQVLPPQAGMYIDNPGRFFTIRLINNTDQVQQVHLGLQLEQHYPEQGLWVSTNMNNNHIPRQPIVLQPNQHKTLNSIEAKHLLDHFTASDFFIREGDHYNVADGSYGLMPEGEYEVFLTAYKWDPTLTSPVVLSDPQGGNALFNICYAAQPPAFIQPFQSPAIDGLSDLKVVKVNKNMPLLFQWTAPTLNCNVASIGFNYDVRIVELGSLMPDEAMQPTTQTFYERKSLTTSMLEVPHAYLSQMIGSSDSIGKIYALQVTAKTNYQSLNTLNYTLLENDGKSPILLFQLYNPNYKPKEEPKDTTKTGGIIIDVTDGDTKSEKDELYVFEQPTLIRPIFAKENLSRVIYEGDSICAEWRKAWFAGGIGERQDTIQFEYNLALYKGNTADKKEAIFDTKPVYEKKLKDNEFKHVIKWDQIENKVNNGDYFYLRVKAKPTNIADSLIRMHADSLNYKDFALVSKFDENYQCGHDNKKVENQTPVTSPIGKNQQIKIGQFYLTFDKELNYEDGYTGNGWIQWSPTEDKFINFSARVAVKFEKLKVNTDYEVYEGKCRTYSKVDEQLDGNFTASQFVDSLFSLEGLNQIYGALQLPEDVRNRVSGFVDDYGKELFPNLAQSYNLGHYYSMIKKGDRVLDALASGNIDLYFPLALPEVIQSKLPGNFNVQVASMQFTPQSAQMNLIGEIALPNSDVFDGQDVLIFGAPRLCISPDRFFPEEGALALLSNLPLKDPNSEFEMVFKAPTELLSPTPSNGCFLTWNDDGFSGLGMEIAMTLPNTKRVVNGKTKDYPALLDLKAQVEGGDDACDFIATGTLTPFEVKDLPGWKFSPSETIIFDFSLGRNDPLMPKLSEVRRTFAPMAWDEKAKKYKADANGSTFNPALCGAHVQNDWNCWQGVYIDNFFVEFPKYAVFGNGKAGSKLGLKSMLIDASGVSCRVFAENVLDAETGKLGGWKFSIDHIYLDFVQNNFDNCEMKGGIGVPLLGKKAQDKAKDESNKKNGGKNDGKSGKTSGSSTGGSGQGTSGKDGNKDKQNEEKPQETDIEYTCQIRHLTSPNYEEFTVYSDKEGKKKETLKRKTYDDNKLAYVFKAENVEQADLQMNFFVADLTLYGKQTYFLVESVEKDVEGTEETEMDTQVELCLAGNISIAGADDPDNRLKKYLNNLPLKLKLPGIEFAKMRLSNKQYEKWTDYSGIDGGIRKAAETDYNAKLEEHKKSVWYREFTKGKELALGSDCYFNYGEWSLASPEKKVGPFSYNLVKFDVAYKEDKLTLDMEGKLGFIDNKIQVDAGIAIGAKLNREGDGIADWYLSDGEVDFKKIEVDVDWEVFKFYGMLHMVDSVAKDADNREVAIKGYHGALGIEVQELFKLDCEGGYFTSNEAPSAEEEKIMKEEAAKRAEEENKALGKAVYSADDFLDKLETRSYSWGYFLCSVEGKALRFDPLVINRVSGGFFFNCTPNKTKLSAPGKPDYTGMPTPKYGSIGVALGLGMETTGGDGVVKADMDLMVVYDRQNSCLSMFLFNGNVEAVGGMIKADARLLYVNEKSMGQTKNRYLVLNVTTNFGVNSETLKGVVLEKCSTLNDVKNELESFTSNLGTDLKLDQALPMLGMDGISENKTNKESEADKYKPKDFSAGQSKIALEMKITWVEDSKKNSPVKWHLYLGEPAKDKRCTFTYLKFNSSIVTVDIGADGYICVGNELPDNGKLPDIPEEIKKFLDDGKKTAGASEVSTDASLEKAERSRAQATRDILNSASVKGGAMVGASAWGNINVDLGLIYGDLKSLGGFDASLIHYGNGAVCVNSGESMGYNGWYAMGQLYAYLNLDLGIHVHIGKLINWKGTLIEAGMGGLLEIGLPSPTWLEGKLKCKINLLDGLYKKTTSFSFSAGDHCVPFVGNALDGFEMFQNVSLGSDSLYQALNQPEFAISKNDANRLTFSTNTSLGSHYRLVDPSYSAVTGNDSKLNLHNSRTYVFDMDKNQNMNKMKMGVRMFDLGEIRQNGDRNEEEFLQGLKWIDSKRGYSWYKKEFKHRGGSRMSQGEIDDFIKNGVPNYYPTLKQFVAIYLGDRASTTDETSIVMDGYNIDAAKKKRMLDYTNVVSYLEEIIDSNKAFADAEVNVSFREDGGTQFHLTNMDLKPGHSYMLMLKGDAYEIKDGKRRWVDYYDEDRGNEAVKIHWRQTKIWFLRVKSEEEDKVAGDSLRSLTPYVALAYPSVDGTNVQNVGRGYVTAYINDILHPTVALNRKLTTELPESTMEWVLKAYNAKDVGNESAKPYTQKRDAHYRIKGNCINLEPLTPFNKRNSFTEAHAAAGSAYDFNSEVYNLQLTHTFKYEGRDSTVALVNLWLNPAPYDVTINGTKYDDNWMQTTNRNVTGELLDYAKPFVGARPWEAPVIDYASELGDNSAGSTTGGLRSAYDLTNLMDKDEADDPYIYDVKKWNEKPFRLVDPYLYMAYLAKWTFIGDRKISKYAFDDQEVAFGAEALTFQKGTTVIDAEFLKNADNKTLTDLRLDMYKTWNDWYYNNRTLPEYSLPITLDAMGGPTANNQDERTSSFTPINLNFTNDYTLCVNDLVRDFAAPYNVAAEMSIKLKEASAELFNLFARNYGYKKDKNDQPVLDKNGNLVNEFSDNDFNGSVLNWNKTHRGQYLEVTVGDVTAKVPYYQLPLIFGDCFGHMKNNNIYGDKNAYYNETKLNRDNRSFRTSIGEDDITDKERRWPSQASNIFFFRLLGNEPTNSAGITPKVFSKYTTGDWTKSYINNNARSANAQVAWDKYDAAEGLKAVSKFKARIYRVDAYDMETGLYKMSNTDSVADGMGGGPWYVDVTIDASNALAKNLNDINTIINKNDEYLSTHYDRPVPQGIVTKETKNGQTLTTMTMVNSDVIYTKDDSFNGKAIVSVMSGDDFHKLMCAGRLSVANVSKVVIDQSMADVTIPSTSNWFANCGKLTAIEGMQYLNTSKTTDMSHMFDQCARLASIDVSRFVADKVENASYLFARCSALTSLDASKMTMPAVKDVSYMFMNCSKLQNLKLNEMTAGKAVNTKSMFYGCSSLSKLYINKFAPETIEKQPSKQYNTMFTSVSSKVTVWYNFFLADCIKNQIPGTKVETNNPAKAIYATDETGEKVLLFIYLDEEIKTGTTRDLKGRNFTYKNMTVNSFWKEKEVTNQTADQPAWKNVIRLVDKVIIDPSFTRPVASVKGWFENGSKIKSIQGLTNLNTSKCKSFERMFNGCSSLESLDVSTFDAKRVTDMTQMFMNCKSLTTLKLKDEQGNGLLTASSLTSMKYMFYNCMKLQTLEFGSKFRSYANTSLEGMFFGCKNLKTINRPFMGKNMSYLYDGCESLETVMTTDETGSENNVAYAGTGVTNMECMFRKCKSLKKIDLKDFNPKDVKNTSKMFYGCSALQDLDLSSFMAPASANYSCEDMFYGVNKDCYIFLPSKASDKIYPAQLKEDTYPNLIIIGSTQVLLCGTRPYCQLVFIDGEGHDFGSGTRRYKGKAITGIYSGRSMLVSTTQPWAENAADIETVIFDESFKSAKPRCMASWFKGMTRLTSIEGLENLNTSKTSDMSSMFEGCSSLKELDLSGFNTQSLEKMDNMFKSCTSLETLNLESFNTAKVTGMEGAFSFCTAMTTLSVGDQCSLSAVEKKNAFDDVSDLQVFVPDLVFDQVRTDFQNKLGFVEGVTGYFGKPTPQVIWTEGNKTLTFIYTRELKTGDTFNGQTVTQVWSGDKVTNSQGSMQNPLWFNRVQSLVKTVEFDKTFAKVMPKNTTSWFENFTELTTIKGLNYLNTEQVTNMAEMFAGCRYLTSIDLSTFNTANVTSMAGMFRDCTGLKTLNLEDFNTEKVTDISRMFYNCSELYRLNMTSFDTRKVTNGTALFSRCPQLTELRVGENFILDKMGNTSTTANWRAGRATKIEHPFMDASYIEVILPEQNTEAVKSTFVNKLMFEEGKHGWFITGEDVGQAIWTSENTTLTFLNRHQFKAGDYFYGAKVTKVWKIADLTAASPNPWYNDVRGSVTKVVFDESFRKVKPTTTAGWFRNFTKLTSIEGLNYLNTADVTDMSWMFYYCINLETLDVSGFNTINVTNMKCMFASCEKLKTLSFKSGFDTRNVTDMGSMFNSCKVLNIDFAECNFNTQNVTNMATMFTNCAALTYDLNMVTLKSPKCTNYGNMFGGCTKLKYVSSELMQYRDAEATASGVVMRNMFNGCSALLKFGGKIDLTNVTTTESMFTGCTQLTGDNTATVVIEGTWSGSAKLTNVYGMFKDCPALKTVTFNSGKKSYYESVSTAAYMFSGCTGLLTVTLPDNMTNVVNTKGMFSNCTSLKSLTIDVYSTSFNKNTSSYTSMFQNVPTTAGITLRYTQTADYNSSKTKLTTRGFQGNYYGIKK